MQKEQKNNKGSIWKVVVVEVLSLLAAMVILFLRVEGNEVWVLYRYVDLITLLLLLVLSLPTVIVSGRWNDFIRVFSLNEKEKNFKLSELKNTLDAVELLQKQLLYATGVIVAFHMISMLYTMTELATLGPNMASILMSIMYVSILELLIMPFSVMLKKKITDFMEEN